MNFADRDASALARALGRFGKGRKKTMTSEAIEQRRKAAKAKRKPRSPEHVEPITSTE